MKCGATALRALLPAGRSGRRRRDQGTGGETFIRAARQRRPGGIGRHAGSGGVCATEELEDGEALSAPARAEPALLSPERSRTSQTFGLTLPEHGHPRPLSGRA